MKINGLLKNNIIIFVLYAHLSRKFIIIHIIFYLTSINFNVIFIQHKIPQKQHTKGIIFKTKYNNY